ncbi:Threonine/homoserine efflux transporter RhtA [Brevibacterium siliguriense]|uniref:Threonine/homoserine efflux transporter RhtA n=1 Tax=Brevibacterium siliguriense TaxID=1136497 RepID=A0A1H1N1H0_9MICO|nr:DMT family transporter [Brevibacterium siliguriense]SDR92971.1 Threonine/homoserine efflux transporter RhtA [Brevibacterium siliguriense]
MNRSAVSTRVASPNPRQTTPPRVLPWIAALLTMTFWASSFVVIRDAGEVFSPGPMALLRGASAAVVLSVWMLFRRPRFPSGKVVWLILALWGVAWFSAYVVVLNAAERSIDAGTASMIVNIAPLIIAVFAGLVLGEGLPKRLLIGIFVSLLGIAMITAASFNGFFTVGGLVLSLVAAVLYAACVLLQKHFLSGEDSVTVTWMGILIGALVSLIFAPGLIDEVAAAPIELTLQVVYLGVVPTAIAFNLWGYALKFLPAGLLSSSSLLVPAIVVVMAWIILGEVPPPLAAVGGVLCLAGASAAIGPQIMRALRRSPAQV